jgi:hypothetical protein
LSTPPTRQTTPGALQFFSVVGSVEVAAEASAALLAVAVDEAGVVVVEVNSSVDL